MRNASLLEDLQSKLVSPRGRVFLLLVADIVIRSSGASQSCGKDSALTEKTDIRGAPRGKLS